MNRLIPVFLCALCLVAGCNSTTIKTTEQTPAVVQAPDSIPENQLLDVGIGVFNPGVDELKGDADPAVFPAIRKAEARYFPNTLATTLQNTGAWGVVRVVPDRRSEMDIWVDGEILSSDGEMLKVQVTVSDSSGKRWFTKIYQEEASKYSYAEDVPATSEPFQGIYNRIANDMLAFRSVMKPADITTLRRITELRFAQRFAPEAFSGYLAQDSDGRYTIARLPADNDPLMARIRRIRERDNLFVDTLQDYYGSFASQMAPPYRQWRKESYQEAQELREAKSQSVGRMVGGALAIAAGIAAAIASGSSSNPGVQAVGQAAGVVGGIGGAMLIKSGLDKRADVKMHEESLKELASSLDADIKPHTMTLQDHTVTLTGTVEQQYNEWRGILRQIYETETGNVGAANDAPQPAVAH